MKKIDEVIAREKVDAKAIRIYSGKLMKEVDSSKERGENPHLYIQRTYNEKRHLPEIQIVLMGEHHIENLNYFNSDPKKWKSFGAIVLSLEDAEQFADKLKKVVPVHEEILKAMTVEMEGTTEDTGDTGVTEVSEGVGEASEGAHTPQKSGKSGMSGRSGSKDEPKVERISGAMRVRLIPARKVERAIVTFWKRRAVRG